jgi:hypothetical protein
VLQIATPLFICLNWQEASLDKGHKTVDIIVHRSDKIQAINIHSI